MAITVNISSQIVVQTAAQWAADATVYSAKRILVTSDVYYGSTDQRKFKIADGVQTWTQLDYMPLDAETTASMGALINSATAATPNDIDFVATAESGGLLKKITWTNVKAFLKTYFDTLYQAAGSYVTTARTISTTAPLSGGGDLSANRTLTTSMNTSKLIGRGTAGVGVMEEITLGTGLSLSGTTLNSSASPGGANTNIQFNDSGAFGGNSGFTYQEDLKAVNLTNDQMIKSLGKCYMMAYNGRSATEDQKIGLAYSIDGVTFFKSKSNPILTYGAGGAFDDTHLAHPHLLKVNDTYYIYYSAFDGTNYTIGLATSRDAVSWTKYGQVLTLGAGGTWDDFHVFMPEVIYDEDEADATRRWKMWYTGSPDGTTYQTGYAYSSNGLSWTKYAANPVLVKGGVGTWDEDGTLNSHVIKINSTYYLIYEGSPAGSASSSIGVASFANPESSYTKDAGNPMLANRGSATAALTANTLTSSKTVTVANTALFNVNEYVFMDDGNSTEQINRIVSIDSGTQLTMRDAAASDFTTAQSAYIRSIYYGKISPSSVVVEDGRLRIFIAAYGAISGLQREFSAAITATTPTSGYSYDYNYGMVLSCFGSNTDSVSTDWDYTSAENPTVIINGLDEVFYSMRYALSPLTIKGFLNGNVDPGWSSSSSVGSLQIGSRLGLWNEGTSSNIGNNIYWDGTNYRAITNAASSYIYQIGGEIWFISGASAAVGAVVTRSYPAKISSGNFHVGNGTNPTSANGSLIVVNSTAPASSPADQFSLYANDIVAGNSAPHFRTENGNIIKLFRGAAITDASGGATIDAEARTAINALLARMRVTGGNGLIAD